MWAAADHRAVGCWAVDALLQLNSKGEDGRKHLVELQQQLAFYKASTDRLLLRQAGYRVVSKLVRLHMMLPNGSHPSPFIAAKYNLANLLTAKCTDKAAVQAVLAKYQIETAMSFVADNGLTNAHPYEVLNPDGTKRPIEMADLVRAADEEYPAATFPDLLACLGELSIQLGEELFVSTQKPQLPPL